MNIVQLLPYIFLATIVMSLIAIGLWIWLLIVPGNSYWALVKSRFPWNKGSRNLIHLFTSGTQVKHIFVRKLPLDKLYKAVSSRNKLQEQFIYLPEVYHLDESGTPVFICHEYSPIGLLIRMLNLDKEMKQLEDALILSDKVLDSKDIDVKNEFILGINRLLPQIRPKLNFIPKAIPLVDETIYWNNDSAKITDITDGNKEKYFNSLPINKRIEYYIDHLVRIRERIMEKNRTFVTSTELFHALSGQKHMKQSITLSHIDGFLEAMMSIKSKDFWFWIIAGLVVISGIIGIVNMSSVNKVKAQLTTMQKELNYIEYDTNSIAHYLIPTDINGHYVIPNKTAQQNLIPTNIPNTR